MKESVSHTNCNLGESKTIEVGSPGNSQRMNPLRKRHRMGMMIFVGELLQE